ncbi:PCI domain protein [Pelomyxa schiedti]|nr:PCI domain protein [Pelomyxa schiedti]
MMNNIAQQVMEANDNMDGQQLAAVLSLPIDRRADGGDVGAAARRAPASSPLAARLRQIDSSARSVQGFPREFSAPSASASPAAAAHGVVPPSPAASDAVLAFFSARMEPALARACAEHVLCCMCILAHAKSPPASSASSSASSASGPGKAKLALGVAYVHQTVVAQQLNDIMGSQGYGWAMPAFLTSIADLRLLGRAADLEETAAANASPLPSASTSTPTSTSTATSTSTSTSTSASSASEVQVVRKANKNTYLSDAARIISHCLQTCQIDRKTDAASSKTAALLPLSNHLFKIYFRLGLTALRNRLGKTLDKYTNGVPSLHKSDDVCFQFYRGRSALLDGEYPIAEKLLFTAFTNCHESSKKNRRMSLFYLVPVMMLHGKMPPRGLLETHGLDCYTDIVQAVRTGDLCLMLQAFQDYGDLFVRKGVFLVLEQLQCMVMRTLFRKCWVLSGRESKMFLRVFEAALRYSTTHRPVVKPADAVSVWDSCTEVDKDHLECHIANLIYNKLIKGYMSHQHAVLVLSREDPFPTPSSLYTNF